MLRDIIVFGEDWGSHPSSTQHLIKRLKMNRNIIWVNSMGLRAPNLTLKDLTRLVRKGMAMIHSSHAKCLSNFSIVSPQAIPLYAHQWARWVNRRLLSLRLKNEMHSRKIRTPLVWVSLPSAVDVVGELGERGVVYYCGDDFSALAGVDHQPISSMEQELVEKADIILVASEKLLEKFPKEKTHLVPHGVDISLFQNEQKMPADLPLGKPIAGFYGNLSKWIDVELIAETARSLQDWNFVLIGPNNMDLSILANEKNIHLLGEKEHSQLPAYVQHWDVSLLPFVNNEQIRACNPLKLREYLAVGKPVVSTDFPALNPYREHVYVARSNADFVNLIKKAKAEPGVYQDRRRALVMEESWEMRAILVEELLRKLN